MLLSLIGSPGCGRFSSPELTIIVISLDTTRADHLSAYGYDRNTTPTLARLAEEGALFTNARSTSSWTLPAHMSLITGLPPGLHDVVIDFQVLDKGRRTLGEIFQDAGYRTMGVYSAPYVHGYYGFARGMDFYERATLEPMLFDIPQNQRNAQMGTREHASHREITSQRIVDRALRLMVQDDTDSNMIFLHFFDPHYDYRAPPKIARQFTDPVYSGRISGNRIASDADLLGGKIDAADRAQLEALYDAELAWVDQNIGRLLETLEARGRLDNAVVVVTGDHGEEFYERGRFGHRAGLMDEVLRVPLIIWAPGLIPAGRVIEDDVAIYDVLPTLIDYAGLSEEPGVYGRSLKPLIDGERLPPRPVTSALSFFPRELRGYYVLHESMVLERMKLVRRLHVAWSPDKQADLGGSWDPDSVEWELYDLREDPGETINLIGAGDPRERPILDAFAQETQRQKNAFIAYQPQGSPGASLDMDLMEMMAELGYGGPAQSPASAEVDSADESGR
jgi:arylsulfatase A-like enzyme